MYTEIGGGYPITEQRRKEQNMKKKSAAVATALACAGVLACICALSACGDGRETIYNKTFTLTGGHTTDWTGKNFSDNYGELGEDISQKRIVETYWDKIDWSASGIEDSLANADALIAYVDAAPIFKELEGLTFSFTGKDDLKLTLTLPESLSDWGYGTSVEMPFAETQEKFNELGVSLTWNGGSVTPYFSDETGFGGYGVKEEANGFFFVEFKVGYNGIQFSFVKIVNDVRTVDRNSRGMCPTLISKEGSTIIQISLYPKYTATKN